MGLARLVTLALCVAWVSAQLPVHRIRIDVDLVLNTVEAEFLSFTLDSYAFVPGGSNNFLDQEANDTRLVNLMSALAPAYFRVGGTYSTYMGFNYNLEKLGAANLLPQMYTMTPAQWDFLVGVTRNSGNQLLFDLNAQLLYGNEWLPANAIELFDYCAEKGYGDNLHFELGNEPNAYVKHDGQALTGYQIADSFNNLRAVMDTYPLFNNSKLLGPDQVGLISNKNKNLLSDIVENCGQNLDAITIHQYYVAEAPDWQALVDPAEFPELESLILLVQGVVNDTSHPNVPIWLGETGDTFSSQTVASKRYASGLLWLDKLGVSARNGINVVMRQALYASNAGLLYLDYTTLPDYWLSVLYKRLVGRKVLDPWFALGGDYVHAYAHCAETSSGQYNSSDVVIYALNLNQTSDVEVVFRGEMIGKTMHVYHLVPDGDDPEPMLAEFVSLAGTRLVLENGGTTLPTLGYTTQIASNRYTLPSLQYAFFVVLGVNAPACL